MERTYYAAKMPNRQRIGALWGVCGGSTFSEQAYRHVLHQMLGVGSGAGGNLRFLLGREMYFHASRLRKHRLRGSGYRAFALSVLRVRRKTKANVEREQGQKMHSRNLTFSIPTANQELPLFAYL